jgi:hypothetical protein
MAHVCRVCSRVNPPEALYCYHDGAALDARHADAPLDAGRRPFPAPFVFPSGRACRNFDQLLLACEDEWDAARDLMSKGFLAAFLAGLGRADLAGAAERAAEQPDRDRAFDDLLARLPGTSRTPPSLVVRPAEITLGQLRPGDDHRLVFQLENQGGGLLYGSVLAKDDWLRIGDAPGLAQKAVEFRGHVELAVRVVGRALRAGDKPLAGRLVLRTNGGERTVTFRAEVPPQLFADGVLAGARTPRELAHKARDHAKEAARLFEDGAVRQWYEANGWTYPVRGPGATGLAAVQQFFEALGLVDPPRVRLLTESLRLEGRAGQELEATLTVQAVERSPVYVHGTATEEWLQVGAPQLHGQTARVPVRVPATPNRLGETLRALVWLTANGGQRLTADVELTVTGKPLPPPLPAEVGAASRAAPEAPQVRLGGAPGTPDLPAVPPPPLPETEPTKANPDASPAPPRERRPLRLHRLPVVVLLLLLLAPCLRDSAWLVYVANVRGVGVGPPHPDAPRVAVHFHDTDEPSFIRPEGAKPGKSRETPVVWPASMRFGIVRIADERGRTVYADDRLTFDRQGRSNNTVVRLDGQETVFGEQGYRLPNGKVIGSAPGAWRLSSQPLGNDETGRPRVGRQSVWAYPQQISVTQIVEVVEGPQSGVPDTVLVRYVLANEGRSPHRVGLHFLLDANVGAGVPFLIPGQEQLRTTGVVFDNPRTLPDFLQARQRPDLADPGTVAQLQFRWPGVEAPNYVTLGAWPTAETTGDTPKPDEPRWELPDHAMQRSHPPNSVVVMYWPERELPPHETREVGFAYGLGRVHGDQGRGKLAVTVGGSFLPEGEFTVAAYVRGRVPGQAVGLALPPGFALIAGGERQIVQPPAEGAGGVSPVTWRVRGPAQEGEYTLTVQSSDGAAQGAPVKIQARGILGGN